MPAPGAIPEKDYDAIDLGRGEDGIWRVATRYSDGSYVVWNAEGANEELAYIEPGRSGPIDIGGGRAAVVNPDKSLTAYSITNPPPEFAGAPAAGATGVPGNPSSSNPISTAPGGYGSRGFLPSGEPRPTNLLEGSTDFGRGPNVNIRPEYGAILQNPQQQQALAPGYLQGSGTYNQYRLDQGGLFGQVPGQAGTVNLRYGLGGTGDPTTGGEVQTPQRYITGIATDSGQAMTGDPEWRETGGTYKGGGGWDAALAGVGPYRPGPASGGVPGVTGVPGYSGYGQPGYFPGAGGGGMQSDPYDGAYLDAAGGGGSGGGFFGSNRTANWGQGDQAGTGLDYIATLFLRGDTPTGINTTAWSAPPQMWQGLLQQIRAGDIYVRDPQAWAMIREKTGATPESIGGAATGGQNVGPGGASTDEAIANGNAAAAADKAAYWAYQQAMLAQGDRRIALEAARDAWSKTYQEAGLTGQYNGQDTMAQQLQRANLTGMFNGAPTFAREQQEDLVRSQQDATAVSLLNAQAQLQGPRNWARYQSTFGSTPQGLRDVMSAFQGRYQLPTGTGAQAQAQGGRQSVAGLGGDILSGTYGQDGQTQALVNPRQADVQNWARMQPSQREMILGQYEDQGWYGADVENLIKGAAPRYAGPASANYNFFAK